MKIVAVASMEKKSWLHTVKHDATTADLVVVAGRLISGPAEDELSFRAELDRLAEWSRALREVGKLAIASDAHDYEVVQWARAAGWAANKWKECLPLGVVTEGNNLVVAGPGGRALVSVFGPIIRFPELWIHQWSCARLTAAHFGLPWIVVRAPSPGATPLTAWFNPWTGVDHELERDAFHSAILNHQPTAVFCGLPSNAPFEGGHWFGMVGDTPVFSPGVQTRSAFPCRIEVDLKLGSATWKVPGIPSSTVSFRFSRTERLLVK